MEEIKNGGTMSEKKPSILARLFLSETLLDKGLSARIAYIGVVTALCILSNMFEFKFADTQFSLTVFFSMLAGLLIGPAFGFVAAFLGDGIGYLVNSFGYLYMPWVGLSCAAMALLSGLFLRIPLHFKGSLYVKLALLCLVSLLVCSVGINTTGFYLYYTRVGFTEKALDLIFEHFGEGNSYLAYAAVRLIFMGQLWNNLLNYALLFVFVPALRAVKPLKIHLG